MPALKEKSRISLIPRCALSVVGASRRFEVMQLALVAVVHAVSSLSESEAKVDVFEAVEKRLVEPPYLLERRASDRETGTSDRLDRSRLLYSWVISSKAAVGMPRQTIAAEHDASVLDSSL